jgi:uncharacterized delta-60 repeat protein
MKTKIFLSLIISLMTLLCPNAFSQIIQEWDLRLNGTGNSADLSVSAVVDNSGNLIVTGYGINSGTGRDFITVKYNSDGVVQWVRTYNGTINGGDYSFAVAIDASDNVYVTGRSDRGSPTLSDMTTVKYNPAGVLQWAVHYNGPGNGVDEGLAITLDNLNNVYVAGRCMGSGTGQDMVIIKYNNSGVQQWAQNYNGTANSTDAASSMAVDAFWNVYICGASIGSTSGSDFMVIKYDQSGNEQWVKRINGPANGGDVAEELMIDASGGIYATGFVWAGSFGYDFYTVKFNSFGAIQWEQRYNGAGNLYDFAHSIDLDPVGNIYVGGQSTGSSLNYDYALIKYNSSGIQQWVQTYNGPANGSDEAYSVMLDPSGNIYIGGGSASISNGMDFVLIKYNLLGVQQWIETYNGTGNGNDYIRSIAIDNSNIYVTGESFGSGSNLDFATVKYFQCTLTVNAGGDTTIIKGYGGQSAYLTAIPANGMPPFSYVWSNGDTTQSITVTPEQTTEYIVNISDAKGCIASDTVTVFVTDILCGNGEHKVLVCHKGNTICIDTNAVRAHLKHGDYLGPCSSNQISGDETPQTDKLFTNYPNPFNPVTYIKFSLSSSALVKLTIYDCVGREVSLLVNSRMEPGTYNIEWDGSNLPSGVYFYKLEAGNFNETRKMVLLK